MPKLIYIILLEKEIQKYVGVTSHITERKKTTSLRKFLVKP